MQFYSSKKRAPLLLFYFTFAFLTWTLWLSSSQASSKEMGLGLTNLHGEETSSQTDIQNCSENDMDRRWECIWRSLWLQNLELVNLLTKDIEVFLISPIPGTLQIDSYRNTQFHRLAVKEIEQEAMNDFEKAIASFSRDSSEDLPEILSRFNQAGETCLHALCLRGHFNLFKRILNLIGPEAIKSQQDISNKNILHAAASSGHQQLVQLLISHFPELVLKKSRLGLMPICIAFIKGHIEIIQKLFDSMEPNVWKTHRSNQGLSILFYLILIKDQNLIEKVLTRIDFDLNFLSKLLEEAPEIENRILFTPLYGAVYKGNSVVTAVFIKEHVKRNIPFYNSSNHSRLILHKASMSKEFDAYPLLLEKVPELLKLQDGHGYTPLHYGAREGNLANLAKLLEISDSEDIDKRSLHDETPIKLAIQFSRPEALELLLKAGANPHQLTKEQTPLTFYPGISLNQFILNQSEPGTKLNLEKEAVENTMKIFYRLLNLGLKIEKRDQVMNTLLHKSIINKNAIMLKALAKLLAENSEFFDQFSNSLYENAVSLDSDLCTPLELLFTSEDSKTVRAYLLFLSKLKLNVSDFEPLLPKGLGGRNILDLVIKNELQIHRAIKIILEIIDTPKYIDDFLPYGGDAEELKKFIHRLFRVLLIKDSEDKNFILLLLSGSTKVSKAESRKILESMIHYIADDPDHFLPFDVWLGSGQDHLLFKLIESGDLEAIQIIKPFLTQKSLLQKNPSGLTPFELAEQLGKLVIHEELLHIFPNLPPDDSWILRNPTDAIDWLCLNFRNKPNCDEPWFTGSEKDANFKTQ